MGLKKINILIDEKGNVNISVENEIEEKKEKKIVLKKNSEPS